jgi:AraC-like DNA-binding protein
MQNRSLSNLPVIFADDPPLAFGSGAHCGAPGELAVYDVTYLHFHRWLELGLCVGGEGVCCVEDDEYPFRAGDVQVIFPFQKHLSRNRGSSPSRWYWITLDVPRVLRQAGFEDVGRVSGWMYREMGLCGIISPKKYPAVCADVKRIVRGACLPEREPLHGPEEAAVSLLELLLHLCEASRELPKLQLRTESSIASIAPALRLARETFDAGEIPCVASMGAACGMSPANFRRVFRREMGVCPKDHITACCIHRAKRLLACTDLSVIDVAASVGYQDISGFNRAFLRLAGQTPTAFRREIRK